MAATMKHRRSSQKRNLSRSSNRYDKLLTKFKKMKKFGGSFFIVSKFTGEKALSHRVTKESNIYKGVKVLNSSK